MQAEVQFVLVDGAKSPLHQNAGWEVFPLANSVIAPGERAVIRTGVIVAMPPGMYCRISPRTTREHGVDVLSTIIDSDTRGEIEVVLFNHDANEHFYVRRNLAMAQLIFQLLPNVVMRKYDILDLGNP
jgi:dUTP pyrophosphatase